MSNPPLTPETPGQAATPAEPSSSGQAPAAPNQKSDFNIGEEYGTARKSLPPAGSSPFAC